MFSCFILKGEGTHSYGPSVPHPVFSALPFGSELSGSDLRPDSTGQSNTAGTAATTQTVLFPWH